jgi:hypothetical protein
VCICLFIIHILKTCAYKTEYAAIEWVGVYVVYSALALILKGCSSWWNYNQPSRYRRCYWKVGFADVCVTWQLIPRIIRKVFYFYIQPTVSWCGSNEFSYICFWDNSYTNFVTIVCRIFVLVFGTLSFIDDCLSTDNKTRRVLSILVGVLIFIVHINAFHIGLIA